MESIIDMKNTTTLFDIARSWLQKHYFSPQSSPLPTHFLPLMNKSLHAMLIKICMAVWNVACLSHHCHHCWSAPPTTSLCSHPLFGLYKYSANVDECQWVPFYLYGGIQWQTFASCALPCQMTFCQTAPLLPSVTQQWSIMEYWCKGTTSTAHHQHTLLSSWANIIK